MRWLLGNNALLSHRQIEKISIPNILPVLDIFINHFHTY